jgi:hypothetical protein
MIYVVLAAIAFTAWRYARAVRAGHSLAVLGELIAAVGGGAIAGIWFGAASRAAMRAIALANASVRFSWSGTMQVLLVFIGFGAAIGILYAGLFRHAFDRSGLLFGGLLTLATWYPLGQAARQLLASPPEGIRFFLTSGAIIAVMWIPYAYLLQIFTPRFVRLLDRCRLARMAHDPNRA